MVARAHRVIWTERARAALDEAVTFVANESPQAARQLGERILDAATSLEDLSERGRKVPEVNDPSIRELLAHPYRVIYHVQKPVVTIIALLHEARDFKRWRDEQGNRL